jgi:hypothetical protein
MFPQHRGIPISMQAKKKIKSNPERKPQYEKGLN